MPQTPQRITRSNSNPNTQEHTRSTKTGPASLEDIGHLIRSAKDEILSKLMTEITQINKCISTLTSKVNNIETGLAEMKTTSERHEQRIKEIGFTVNNLKEDMFSQVTEEVEQRSHRMQNIVSSVECGWTGTVT